MTTRVLPNDEDWVKRAFSDLGLHEKAGTAAHQRIVEMYATAGHPEIKSDEVAWCSAAENTWMIESGIRGTGSLAARSWITWGRGLDIKKLLPRGAVLVFKRGNSSWQGHVCTLLADQGSRLVVIGGNQQDGVTITTLGRSTLIAARWPDTASNSRTLASGATSLLSAFGEQGAGGAADHLDANADAIASAIGTAQSAIQQYASALRWAQYLLIALALISAAYAGYRFVQRHLRHREVPPFDGPADFDVEAAPPRLNRRRLPRKH